MLSPAIPSWSYSGADAGKKGKIQKAYPETRSRHRRRRDIVKKHQKPRGQGMPGGIVEREAAIDASNVMIVCPKCGKPTRVGHKLAKATASSPPQGARLQKVRRLSLTIDEGG